MGIISEDMRHVVREQRLGYAATDCPDGTPNLSPKGTTAFWDADRLIFADIRSPGTVENLRHNSTIEVNVVDPISRKGYRFKGTGMVLTDGDLFDEALEFYLERGVEGEIRAVVLVEVGRALPLTSLHRGKIQQLWQIVIQREDGKGVARGQVRLQNIEAGE